MTGKTAAVIGTGFSGLCSAIRLKQELNIKVDLFEINTDVAGTWQNNRYLGAACDIPSHLYSLSFELNPTWTSHYSGQSEIQAYLSHVARKYDLYKKTRFETEVIKTEWDDHRKQWLVEWRSVVNHQVTGEGYYDFVFAGLGPLRIPNIPEEFKGFQGTIVHTTEWDSSIDYTNKKLAVIGSGASAIQVIPELRKVASHVYSYQRTPAWVVPRDQFTYPRIFKFLLRWVPFLIRFYRNFLFIQHEIYYIIFGYPNSFLSRRVTSFMKKIFAWRLTRAGRPDLVPVLTPDYSIGCKRIAKSENFLEACAKPNVTIIRSGIDQVKGRTLVDKDGNETEVDILILATGFDIQGFTGNLSIRGKDGRSMAEEFSRGFPKTYKSVCATGYPNFFLLLGPSSGLGHNSVVTMIECQVEFAIKCIKHMEKKKASAIEPKESAVDEFVGKLKKSFDGTVWTSGCKSWYMNQEGQPYALWSGTITSYWWALRKVRGEDFELHKKDTITQLPSSL
ncbi:hypothetical protein O0I10_001129 [Lichtheimia ornata]|uniref:4-hydroxyacetophenone monooxygenase n=1 Tax=Lichtheimia ornata TaxID=688661 RepID=A0AAD7Y379_9FUNG|nr:uncharacterized protein O0I10_001129 [Lichtheimia ornata]KAJ8662953.1 hypothetical protein O0I10_001129 [Lichtheimia ornata]